MKPGSSGQVVVKNDVALVRLRDHWLLHLVTAVDGDRVQIGNHRGGINGWAARSSILGRVTEVQR